MEAHHPGGRPRPPASPRARWSQRWPFRLFHSYPRRLHPAHKQPVPMKKLMLAAGAFGVLGLMTPAPRPEAHAHENSSKDFVPPVVFQAAGPTAASIQSSVDEYRAALGAPNNGNAPGPLPGGRREINWDGGGNNQTTSVAGNPFAGFLVTRGALFTTPDGTGFVQAPPAADPVLFPPGGLAGLFGNPTYATIFGTFSPLRLFSPIGGNVTEVHFSVPGGGNIPATTSGFGAVFTDVDQPGGSRSGEKSGNRRASTMIEYFGADGDLLFSSSVPASPGDASLSFFGIVFDDARIARVRITSGAVAPGPDDGRKHDIVVMDDFLYGEPQPLP